MPNYAFNIFHCIKKYQDYATAVAWLERAVNEVEPEKLTEIIASVFDDLFSADRIDLADEFFDRLPSKCSFPGYQSLRTQQAKRIQDENEHKRRAEEKCRLEQEDRERLKLERQIMEDQHERVLKELRDAIINNFLEVHELYNVSWRKYLTEDEFQDELKTFVKYWFDKNLPPSTPTKRV